MKHTNRDMSTDIDKICGESFSKLFNLYDNSMKNFNRSHDYIVIGWSNDEAIKIQNDFIDRSETSSEFKSKWTKFWWKQITPPPESPSESVVLFGIPIIPKKTFENTNCMTLNTIDISELLNIYAEVTNYKSEFNIQEPIDLHLVTDSTHQFEITYF